jgi:hypothetical protein
MPGSSEAAHDAGSLSLQGLTVGGDADALATWLGGSVDGVVAGSGPAGVLEVVLTSDRGPLVLRSGDLG